MRKILTAIILLTLTIPAEAKRHRTYYRPAAVAWATAIRADDQAACQRKAAYMAKYRISGHPLAVIGRFEGTGYGRSTPGTCTPYWRMTLTGDATATATNGVTYRVRSWR